MGSSAVARAPRWRGGVRPGRTVTSDTTPLPERRRLQAPQAPGPGLGPGGLAGVLAKARGAGRQLRVCPLPHGPVAPASPAQCLTSGSHVPGAGDDLAGSAPCAFQAVSRACRGPCFLRFCVRVSGM